MFKMRQIMTRNEIKSVIIPILQKYDIIKASLFGSIVRGEATEESDIDVLVAGTKRVRHQN